MRLHRMRGTHPTSTQLLTRARVRGRAREERSRGFGVPAALWNQGSTLPPESSRALTNTRARDAEACGKGSASTLTE
jgi:hypothetical protein